MAISKQDAKKLAIRYAEMSYVDFHGSPGQVWLVADSLLEIQKKTGVELHSNEWLEELVKEYRNKM